MMFEFECFWIKITLADNTVLNFSVFNPSQDAGAALGINCAGPSSPAPDYSPSPDNLSQRTPEKSPPKPAEAPSPKRRREESPQEVTFQKKLPRPEPITSLNDLKRLLQSNIGSIIHADAAKNNGILSKVARQKLTALILQHEFSSVEDSKKIHQRRFAELAALVKQVFPKEPNIVYYSPAKFSPNGSRTHRACGRFVDYYYNHRRYLKKQKVLTTPATKKQSTGNEPP